jgi:uncharacterized membrane protein
VGNQVSVTLAIAFGVLSTVAIVAYIDHSLRRMQIVEVVRRIAEETVASIRQHSRDFPRGPTDEAALTRGIEVRQERSIENDPSFGIRLLIDIALRALSPGIHDTGVLDLD